MAISMKQSSPASKAALLGILCAVAVALSFLEGLLPALPIPGAKLGLSNIVTMYALSALGLPAALAVAALGAEGESVVTGLEFLDRGYENIKNLLSELGAAIKRVEISPDVVYNRIP